MLGALYIHTHTHCTFACGAMNLKLHTSFKDRSKFLKIFQTKLFNVYIENGHIEFKYMLPQFFRTIVGGNLYSFPTKQVYAKPVYAGKHVRDTSDVCAGSLHRRGTPPR